MEEFYQKIYLFRANRVPPIKIARNSQLQITVETMDYNIPEGSRASAFAKGAFSGAVYTQECTISGNRITFTPASGFFVPGRNSLQYEINDGIIPLAIDVHCELSLPDGGEATTPEEILPYVTRAESAATAAEQWAGNAETWAGSAESWATNAQTYAGYAGNHAQTAGNAASESQAARDEAVQAADRAQEDYTALTNTVDQLKDDLSDKLPKSPADWEAWTAEEQAAARERMGVYTYEELADVTLEEDSVPQFSFGGSYRKLFIYFSIPASNQYDSSFYIKSSGQKAIALVPQNYLLVSGTAKFGVVEIENIDEIWYSNVFVGNTTINMNKGYNSLATNYGETSTKSVNIQTTFPAGARIIIKGVRA